MMDRETRNLEYKEQMTNSFLKTVSAFANYCDGRIVFGVRDNADVVGVSDPAALCLDIENSINDNIDPKPDYRLSVDNKTRTVKLSVFEGMDKPYCYKNKAYKRNDSSTVQVDRLEFSRLVLEGRNRTYEQLKTSEKALSFKLLELELKDKLKITEFDEDILKTLELCDGDSNLNNAAALLSDSNHYKILDIVRFGGSIDEISERVVIENRSILSAYEEAIKVFIRYYRKEIITGARRETVEIIPEKAYREAVANAIVHRTWDVSQSIQIGMFKDRVEITSPGGLPSNLSQEEFLRGRVSFLRNPIIAGVFARLGIIEKFGTGIRRINECYKEMRLKPEFGIFENSITLTLPTTDAVISLDSQEEEIEGLLKPNKIMTRGEIEAASGMERTKVIRILNRLIENRIVERIGTGRGTKYSLIK